MAKKEKIKKKVLIMWICGKVIYWRGGYYDFTGSNSTTSFSETI